MDNEKAWHDFYEDMRVVELTAQLSGGLIHPVEYAQAILDYAVRVGLIVQGEV